MSFFLPFPKYITFNQWAGELIRIYRNERLPIPRDNESWEEWANKIAGVGVFRQNGIPSATTSNKSSKSHNFKNWEDWAKAVYTVMVNSRYK